MTDDEKYARLAAGVFDTYMQGIYYRNVPVDLNHGHQQTLVGMSSFEGIHEDILYDLVPLYDFLYNYLKEHYAASMEIYAGAFKKWADPLLDTTHGTNLSRQTNFTGKHGIRGYRGVYMRRKNRHHNS